MDRERFNSENLVTRLPDRPSIETQIIDGGLGVGKADRLVVQVKTPLTFPRVVRGQTVGGGTSKEAIRRAKRRRGKTSRLSIIDFDPREAANARLFRRLKKPFSYVSNSASGSPSASSAQVLKPSQTW